MLNSMIGSQAASNNSPENRSNVATPQKDISAMAKLLKPLDSISQKSKQQPLKIAHKLSFGSVENPNLDANAQNEKSSSQNKQELDKSFNVDILSDLKSKVHSTVA